MINDGRVLSMMERRNGEITFLQLYSLLTTSIFLSHNTQCVRTPTFGLQKLQKEMK